MNRKNGKDRLDSILYQAADIGSVELDAEKFKRRLLDSKSGKTQSVHVKFSNYKYVWRYIMESKATKYSTAALVILVLALILLSP